MESKSKEQIIEEILEFLKKNEGKEFTLNEIINHLNYKPKLIKMLFKKLASKNEIGSRNAIEGKLYCYNEDIKKRKKNFRTNLLVFLVALLIMLLVGEMAIRIYYFLADKTLGKDQEEICSKQAYKKALYNIEQEQHKIAAGNYTEYDTYLEYSNITGIRLKANRDIHYIASFKGNDSKKIKYYISNLNSKHMRGLKDFTYRKVPNKTRIALLGDSFTWGSDVSIKFAYASILEELMPNSEILNFGMEGIGIDIMYLRWKFEALKFNPDIVIFAVYIDDISRVGYCINKPKLIIKNNKINIENIPPQTEDEIVKNYKKPKFESYLIKHLLFNLKYIKGIEKTKYNFGFKLLDLMLDEMKNKSKEDGTNFMVLIIERGNDYNNTKIELRAIDKLKTILKQKDIIYVDSENIFEKENYIPTDDTIRKKYENNTHFTPKGYGILAQGIKNKLEDENAIPKYKDYLFEWKIDSDEVTSLILQRLILVNKENSSDTKVIYPYELIS